MIKANKLNLFFVIGIFVMTMVGASYTPTGAEAKEKRTLSVGKIGGDVRQLQVDLTKKGYNLEPFDGIFGLRTLEAVRDFQKKNKLKETGVYDRETMTAMKGESQPLNDSRMVRGTDKSSRSFNRDDVMLLARVVNGEARGESFEGQVAVAAVILNRTQSEHFPRTIKGVVFQPGAFDAVSDGQVWLQPDEKAMKAAELAVSGYDPTGNALYYWNPAKTTNKWIWSRPIIKKIGEHVFAR